MVVRILNPLYTHFSIDMMLFTVPGISMHNCGRGTRSRLELVEGSIGVMSSVPFLQLPDCPIAQLPDHGGGGVSPITQFAEFLEEIPALAYSVTICNYVFV